MNVSAAPCLSELSATVTVTWGVDASGVSVMESALKLACDASSPVLLKSKVTESRAVMVVGSKEMTAERPSRIS